jgi:EAL domain-containing protein (putative c-di-GMP-specific phosphodiesterase class I)
LLPVDTLKIDRSFVAGLPTAAAAVALVSTVIALARAFSLTTVAEGVETQEQLQSLRALGCDQSQGYLHGRPQSAREVTRLMLRERPDLKKGLRASLRRVRRRTRQDP